MYGPDLSLPAPPPPGPKKPPDPDKWQPAALWRRVGAGILDYTIFLVLSFLSIIVFEFIVLGDDVSSELDGLSALLLITWLVMLSLSIYVFVPAWIGDTPAKKLFRITVVTYDTGFPPGPHVHFYRMLGWIIDSMWFVLLVIVFTRERRRVGDYFAGTIVVSTSPEKRGRRFAVRYGSPVIDDSFTPSRALPRTLPQKPKSDTGIRLSGRPPRRE